MLVGAGERQRQPFIDAGADGQRAARPGAEGVEPNLGLVLGAAEDGTGLGGARLE